MSGLLASSAFSKFASDWNASGRGRKVSTLLHTTITARLALSSFLKSRMSWRMRLDALAVRLRGLDVVGRDAAHELAVVHALLGLDALEEGLHLLQVLVVRAPRSAAATW